MSLLESYEQSEQNTRLRPIEGRDHQLDSGALAQPLSCTRNWLGFLASCGMAHGERRGVRSAPRSALFDDRNSRFAQREAPVVDPIIFRDMRHSSLPATACTLRILGTDPNTRDGPTHITTAPRAAGPGNISAVVYASFIAATSMV
jgi:hypothetical protein